MTLDEARRVAAAVNKLDDGGFWDMVASLKVAFPEFTWAYIPEIGDITVSGPAKNRLVAGAKMGPDDAGGGS